MNGSLITEVLLLNILQMSIRSYCWNMIIVSNTEYFLSSLKSLITGVLYMEVL